MPPPENKTVITSFVEEVINQGQLERADDLVAVDFVELDPLPGQEKGREGLKQVIGAFRTAFPDNPLGNRGDGRRRGKGI
jgi:hypothetical protein